MSDWWMTLNIKVDPKGFEICLLENWWDDKEMVIMTMN